MIKNHFLVFSFIVLAIPVFAQKNITTKNKQWIQYYNTVKLSKKFLLKSDFGYRVENNFEDKSQYIVRSGLGYKIMPKMQIVVGLDHLGEYRGDSLNSIETRPFQEFTINDIYGEIKTQHRFRIEERFFKPVNSSDFTTYYFRFRYRFNVTIPLYYISKEDKSAKIALNLGDEIFIHAGKDAVYNMFNQNRVLIGSTYQISKALAVRLTYSYEFGANNSPASYRENNILWLGITHKLSAFRKGN